MQISWRRIIFGSPMRTEEYAHQRLTKAKALAVFSSDALSSVAYATEEILLVLVVAGVVALELSLPIALIITGLLVIVVASYYQTVHGYPAGGGPTLWRMTTWACGRASLRLQPCSSTMC